MDPDQRAHRPAPARYAPRPAIPVSRRRREPAALHVLLLRASCPPPFGPAFECVRVLV